MRRWNWTTVLVLPILFAGLAACGDDDDPIDPGNGNGEPETYTLTVTGDDSFGSEHADDDVHVDVEDEGGDLVETESGTVSADGDAFSFTFDDALTEDEDYTVRYWIDASDAGTQGVCDPAGDEPSPDYTGTVDITGASEDVDETVSFDSEATTDCADFAYNLEFSGDDTFVGAHGDDSIHVAVVRDGDVVVADSSGTVATTEGEQAFSFTFENALTRHGDYHIDYWIDSNFEDNGTTGTEGECDDPAIDHQWRIDSEGEEDLAGVTADVTIEDTHRPDETEEVCATFQEDTSGDGALARRASARTGT